MTLRKHIRAAAAAGLLGLLTMVPASDALAAGWSKSGDSWVYYDDNGSLYKGWIRTTERILTEILFPEA